LSAPAPPCRRSQFVAVSARKRAARRALAARRRTRSAPAGLAWRSGRGWPMLFRDRGLLCAASGCCRIGGSRSARLSSWFVVVWDDRVMAKGYRAVRRDQPFLLPPDMRDWLPADHGVWLFIDAVAQLETAALHARRRTGGAGAPGFDPEMLLTLLMWG